MPETIFGFHEGGATDLRGPVSAKLLPIGNHDLEYEKSKLAVRHHVSAAAQAASTRFS